jgi:hypothetical protein
MIGTTAKPTRELPNQLTGMYSIPVSANPIKLKLVVLGAFEQSLGSTRMSFKRTTYADESLCQVWFLRVYRARGLMWSASVVLHDSWWCVVLSF